MAGRLPRVVQPNPDPPLPIPLPGAAAAGPFFVARTRWDLDNGRFNLVGGGRDWMRDQDLKNRSREGLDVQMFWLDHFQTFSGLLKYSGHTLRVQGQGLRSWVQDVAGLQDREVVDIWSYSLADNGIVLVFGPAPPDAAAAAAAAAAQ